MSSASSAMQWPAECHLAEQCMCFRFHQNARWRNRTNGSFRPSWKDNGLGRWRRLGKSRLRGGIERGEYSHRGRRGGCRARRRKSFHRNYRRCAGCVSRRGVGSVEDRQRGAAGRTSFVTLPLPPTSCAPLLPFSCPCVHPICLRPHPDPCGPRRRRLERR